MPNPELLLDADGRLDVRRMATSEIIIMLGDHEIICEMMLPNLFTYVDGELRPTKELDSDQQAEIGRLIADTVAVLSAEIDRRIPIPVDATWIKEGGNG